jgi:uncharacterized repeat protein (TIGR03803 family)
MPENPSRVSDRARARSPIVCRLSGKVRECQLYSFQGKPYDGSSPYAGLTYFKGTFYGTTEYGGSSGSGTVYSITPSGRETVLHSFKGGKDGADPRARLIVRNGTLYGTTSSQGEKCGCGTVFSITPSGHETVLHEFAGPPDGTTPEARLLDVNGTFYGTTEYGGANSCNCGTVFSITPGGQEKVLYSFRGGTDGQFPGSGLTYFNGTLYGTAGGGAYHHGTVFSITPGGKEKVLYSFGASGNDGVGPLVGLVDVSGTFYGATYQGGAYGDGTVFSITPGGKEKVLFSFNGGNGGDGAAPTATLLNVNGTLYGTTAAGGADGYGTVFSTTLSGTETVLYSFKGFQDGELPYSGLSYVNGRFYGTTNLGGAQTGCCGFGTVYSIRP